MSEEVAVQEEVTQGSPVDIDVDSMAPGEAEEYLNGNHSEEEAVAESVDEDTADDQEDAIMLMEEGGDEEEGEVDRISALEEKLNKALEHIENQNKMISKQSNEVGNVRKLQKQLEELQASKADTEEFGIDTLIDDPKAALKRLVAEQNRDQQEEGLKRQIQMEQISEQNRTFLETHAPGVEDRVDSIKELLIKDGAQPEFISNFTKNLYLQDPIVLFNLDQRAQLEAKLKKAEARTQKPKDVLNRVQQAARKGPTVTARSGAKGSTKGIQLTESMINDMPAGEAEKILRSLTG